MQSIVFNIHYYHFLVSSCIWAQVMKKGESFLINQPSVRQLMREIYCISTNAVHLLIMQNHVIINTISATGTTSTTATLTQLLTLQKRQITKIKQPSSSNIILISRPLSPFLYFSLIRRIFSKSTSVQIQSWNILLVRHFSPYAQEWLGFTHCLGYFQQSLGLITMMFQWYLRQESNGDSILFLGSHLMSQVSRYLLHLFQI